MNTASDQAHAIDYLAWAIAHTQAVRRRCSNFTGPMSESAAIAEELGCSLTGLGAALTDVLENHPRHEHAAALEVAVKRAYLIEDLARVLHPTDPATGTETDTEGAET